MKIPKPPAYLSKPAKRFWRDMVSLWQFDQGELRLLETACQALDDVEACRLTVRSEGRFTPNRYNCVIEHPALVAGLKARAQFAAIVKQLDLHDEKPKPKTGRPGADAARLKLLARGKAFERLEVN
jgi:phage terminase small subunit